MLDADLAALYGTGNLNLAVRRNPKRFPEDFMFQLQPGRDGIFAIAKCRAKARGGRRTPPYAPSPSMASQCCPAF